MDRESAKYIVIRVLKASDEISQLLANPLDCTSLKGTANKDILADEISHKVKQMVLLSNDILWRIFEEYPEIEEEIDSIVQKFGRLP